MHFDRNEQTAMQAATKQGHFNVASALIDKSPKVITDLTQ